ncbi:MAG: gamma-glutamylcyclotransferase [Burkholderiales bacterium]|nr:gamma-glutamylcyclotransferase [Burkholderiales bacterium]
MSAHARHPHFGRPLCRDDLLDGSARRRFLQSELGIKTWSDAQLNRSVESTLRQVPPGDIWVFAYGSLIWNPLFPFADKRVARVYGLHRSFCLWSRIGRGTPQQPGLVLGLDHGGQCAGLAYRIEAAHVRDELRLLWRREMVTGAYCPTWVKARTSAGAVPAIAFVINHRSNAYAGRMATPDAARCIVGATGLHGRCAEYLVNTLAGLREHGIEDSELGEVERAVAALAH